jgi:hypothetical protein
MEDANMTDDDLLGQNGDQSTHACLVH